MKTIKIKSIDIQNCYGFAKFHYDFDETYNKLVAPSGMGKSSIRNCVSWCLGHNYKDIYPSIDSYRIKNLETSVALELIIDTKLHSFVRKSTQVYNANNEYIEQEYTYLIDGVSVKANEYLTRVTNYTSIPQKQMDLMIYLPYFNNTLDTKARRDFFFKHFDIDEKVTAIRQQAEYDVIRNDLSLAKDENELFKKYRDELQGIEKSRETNNTIIELRSNDITTLSQNDFITIEAESDYILEQIHELESQKDNTLETLEKEKARVQVEYNAKERTLLQKQHELAIQSADRDKALYTANLKLQTLEEEKQHLSEQLQAISLEVFDNTVCPTCKRPYDSATIDELRTNFENLQATRKQEIAVNSQNKAVDTLKVQESIKLLTEQKQALQSQINDYAKEIATLYADKETRLKDVDSRISEYTTNHNDTERTQKIASLRVQREELLKKLRDREIIETYKQEIERLVAQNVALNQKEALYLQKQQVLSKYLAEKVKATDLEIAPYFDEIKWQFYRWNSSNSENPYTPVCTASLFGTPYENCSQGQKIKVDICVRNGISKILNINMFAFIDEFASCTLDYTTQNQVIELVTDRHQNNIQGIYIKDLYTIDNCDIRNKI